MLYFFQKRFQTSAGVSEPRTVYYNKNRNRNYAFVAMCFNYGSDQTHFHMLHNKNQ